MNIEDMAKAHLETVKKAIADLRTQREKVDQEIDRLVSYVKQGEAIITDYQHVNSGTKQFVS